MAMTETHVTEMKTYNVFSDADPNQPIVQLSYALRRGNYCTLSLQLLSPAQVAAELETVTREVMAAYQQCFKDALAAGMPVTEIEA